MSLLAPLFLLGGLAVSLPLWLHLLERENPVRLPFSSLMFFERRRQSSLRQRRFRYLLLLALRVALYALLALAFAKPIWENATVASLGDIPRLHLIVLDTSLSMGYGDRWDRAVTEARNVVEEMDGNDQAQVIANGPGIRIVTQAIDNRSELISAIQSLQPTASRNSYGEVVEAARSLVPEGELPTEVHLITDLQQSSLPGRFSDLTLPTAGALCLHDVAEESSENWAIESIKGVTRLYGNLKPRLEVTVSAFANEEVSKTLRLEVDGKQVAAETVVIPAGGRATASFEGFTVPAGASPAKVILFPEDALPGDNERLVAFDQSEPLPILFVYGHARRRDLLYYSAALESGREPTFRVQSASAKQVDNLEPGQFATVVLSDVAQLPSRFSNRLSTYVQEGGTVLLAVGQQTALTGTLPLLGETVETNYVDRAGRRFQSVGEVDEPHPVIERLEGLRRVKFFRYAELSEAPGDEVLARLTDGSPLLLERPLGEGRVMVFASSLDNVWNDLPLQPVFVPFVAESASYLAAVEEGEQQALIDSVLELRKRRSAGSSIQVLAPSGERALTLSETVTEEGLTLDQTGFYEIRRPGKTELVAVNPDPRESNLRRIDADTVALWQATGNETDTDATRAGANEAEKAPPSRVWRILLFLAFLVALIESLVGALHLPVRRQVEAT